MLAWLWAALSTVVCSWWTAFNRIQQQNSEHVPHPRWTARRWFFVIIPAPTILSATLCSSLLPRLAAPPPGFVWWCSSSRCLPGTQRAMAAPCLRSDAPSPTRPPRWGTGTGNAGIFCVCRQYKPSLRVCYILDKLLIDFLIFLFEKTWDKAE